MSNSFNEKKENPQSYDLFPCYYTSCKPKRHMLGTVGGNEVSVIKGNQIDLESDLTGRNLPLTRCPEREYQKNSKSTNTIKRENIKGKLEIDTTLSNLKEYQMWAYPGIAMPLPMINETCKRPEKY